MENDEDFIEKDIENIERKSRDLISKTMDETAKTFLVIAATLMGVLVSLHNNTIGCNSIFKAVIISLAICIISGLSKFILRYFSLVSKLNISEDNYINELFGLRPGKIPTSIFGESIVFLIFVLSFLLSIILLTIYAWTL